MIRINPQPGLNREISAPSAALRPMGMSPMLNMATTKLKGRCSDVSVGEWKSNLQTTLVLQGVWAEFKAELNWKTWPQIKAQQVLLFETGITVFGTSDFSKRNCSRPWLSQLCQWLGHSGNFQTTAIFSGLASYYRRFVKDFAKIVSPLNEMLVGPTQHPGNRDSLLPTKWKAFNALKMALTAAPIWGSADFNLPFIVYTDASNQELEAVLS